MYLEYRILIRKFTEKTYTETSQVGVDIKKAAGSY